MNSRCFQATWAGSYRRLFVVSFWIFCTLFILVIEPLFLSSLYNRRHPEDEESMQWLRIFMIGLACFYILPRVIVPMSAEFWRSCFTVAVTDDTVIGLNLWKQEFRVALVDVVEIQPEPASRFLRSAHPGIDLVTARGERLRLHPNIEPFGECVEYIRTRCPNLRKVDYGGINEDLRIWNGTHKF